MSATRFREAADQLGDRETAQMIAINAQATAGAGPAR